MKKKIMLLLTLIVSLFIYSSRVEAVVMWMQCTSNPNDKMSVFKQDIVDENSDGFKDDFNKYNTIAVINSYDNSPDYTRRVIYFGGADSNGVQNRFFAASDNPGPTFFVNKESPEKSVYENEICWYSKNMPVNIDIDDMVNDCDEDNGNPFISKDLFDQGYCPEAFYQTGETDSSGILGDFAFATGKKQALSNNVEYLNDNKIVIYKVNYNLGSDKYSMTIMETYNRNGTYGIIYGISDSGAESIYEKHYSDGWDNKAYFIPQWFLKIPTVADNFDELLYFYTDTSNNKSNIAKNQRFRYNKTYVNYTQSLQLIRIYLLGRNYFKLDEYMQYPKVLVGNLTADDSSLFDGTNFKQSVDYNSPIYAYGSAKNDVWQAVKEWTQETKNAQSEQAPILNKFNDDGEYSNLLNNAQKVNDLLEAGKTPSTANLGNINYSNEITFLNNAYTDLNSLSSKEFGFPEYFNTFGGLKPFNSEEIAGTQCVKENSGKLSDAMTSLTDYVSCKTFGHVFSSIKNNYLGQNAESAISTYIEVIQEQYNKETGNNVDLLDLNAALKKYTILLAKYAAYFNKYYANNLTEEQQTMLQEIVDKYLSFVRDKYGVEIVIDCGTLLGEDFIERIEKFVDIIKIAVPIILIGFGILEFVKAFFADDADKMKKAQKKFLMRIVIAILFFLSPFVVKIILSIANKAWSFISPSSCNIM